MKLLSCALVGLIAWSSFARASEPAATRAAPAVPAALAKSKSADKKSKKEHEAAPWAGFSLLPKSLMKNPPLELTVMTDMTEAGKTLPPVSPEEPAYYALHAAGYHELGSPSYAKHPASVGDLEAVLVKSLTGSGYLPAAPGTPPPSLLIIYTWGTLETDEGNEISREKARHFFSRAMLVGGQDFLRQMIALSKESSQLSSEHMGGIIQEIMGSATPMAFVDPFTRFARDSPRNTFLLDQTAMGMYYVIASAYDYQLAAANRRRLLWRTRMTVTSSGVNQIQSIPTLITSASPFFGKEMEAPELLVKHAREGKVELGTPRVVEPTGERP